MTPVTLDRLETAFVVFCFFLIGFLMGVAV